MKKILLIFLILFSLSFATDISSCQAITSPGTYNLVNNLAGNLSDGTCINIQANNVVLDCNGYSITGNASGTTYGIYINSYNNTTIKNCIVSNYTNGFYVSASSYNTLTNNTAYNNSYDGFILVSGSNYNNLTNNTAYNNSYYGFYIYSNSNNNILINNTAYGNTQYGFWLNACSGNKLINNTVNNNGNIGFYISSSSNNNFINNTAYNNPSNFYLGGSNYNNISNSVIYKTGNGIVLSSTSSYNILQNNLIYNSTSNGIHVQSNCNYNNITNNTIYNDVYGIYLASNFYTTVMHNTVFNSSQAGLYLYASSNNTLFNNTAYSNPHNYLIFSNSNYNNITNNIARYGANGFYIYTSSYNYLNNNTAYGGTQNAFYIYLNSYNNTLSNNTAYSQQNGFRIETSSNNTLINNKAYGNSQQGFHIYNSTYNTITDNTAYNNVNHGFYIYLSSGYNTLANNTAYNNSQYQIYLTSSNNNSIYNNIFNATGTQGVVYDSSYNFWNTTYNCAVQSIIGGRCLGGNYYSDYDGWDTNGDMIGDTKNYTIAGGANIDFLPLTFNVYRYPPEILSINITPSVLYTTNNINCTITTRDNDSLYIDITFKWYENGSTLIKSTNYFNQNSSGTYSDILEANYTSKGKNYTCVAVLIDERYNNATANATSSTVLNSNFTATFVGVKPDDARTNSIIYCQINYSDPDSDRGVGVMRWYINDTNNTLNQTIDVASGTTTTFTYTRGVGHGDKITCEAIISDGEASNQTFSNFTYVILPTCNDYYEDSGLFDKVQYGSAIFYYPKDTAPSTYTCYNDKFEYLRPDLNDFTTNLSQNVVLGPYVSPWAFLTNQSFSITELSTSGVHSITIYNRTNSCTASVSSGGSTASFYGYVDLRMNGSTPIIIATATTTYGPTTQTCTLTTDYYFSLKHGFPYSSMPIPNWVRNTTLIKRVGPSGIKTQYGSGITGTTTYTTPVLYPNYTAFVYNTMLNNMKTTPSWFTSSVQKVFFAKNYSSAQAVLYQNQSTTLGTNIYYGYILQNSQIARPLLSLYIRSGSSQVPIVQFYNPSDNRVQFNVNEGMIYVDSYGLCYFVPPYAPSNTSLLYTMTAYQITCPPQLTTTTTYPTLPVNKICKEENGKYIMNVSYSGPVIFERYLTDKNNTVSYTTSTSSVYYEEINTSNYNEINLKVNSVSRCYWNGNSTTLGLPRLDISDSGQKLIVLPIMLLGAAISAVQPFAFIFVIALNDMFNILDVTALFVLGGFIGVFAVISNWQGERTLKTSIILFLLTFAYVVSVHTYNAFESTQIAAVQNVIDNLTDMFNAINTPTDLLAVIAITLPTFLINLIILLLTLPALVIELLLNSIGAVAPALSSALTVFEPPLIAGAYVYLILKGYEMGRNMFRAV